MTFYFGVDYYPEHWPRSCWEEHASLMRQANFNVVRLAEFSWTLLEPEEGRFEFEWLDSAIAVLARQDLAVVLGTPTAAMPAWVKQKYPETLASADGVHRGPWGMRKQNCFSSGAFRLLSERITSAMAERYAGNPAVIGWQTDNEFDGPVCRCGTCCHTFHSFLRQKYQNIDGLNRAWGTDFWSQRYSAWEEIPAPRDASLDNPSLCLDWQRFQTVLQVRFQRDQATILRRACPNHFLTHNFMGTINYSNTFELSQDLDFASFDSYPGYHEPDAPETHYGTSLSCDLTRGLKQKNFWIMETTAGPLGWGEFTQNPKPGELRKFFYQHVAHGADGQLFFRWRTSSAGREQYWHGLLGHDGRIGRRYHEAARIGLEAKILAPHLEGTTISPQVAMIYDYDSRWATDIQPGFRGNAYLESFRRYYDALLRAGVNVDVVSWKSLDASRYRLMIAPQLHVLPDVCAELLNGYVADGGVLLTDARSGVKTETNLCHERRLPGLLSQSLGIEIDEYEAIAGKYAIRGEAGLAGEFTAHQYADWIRPIGAEVLCRYAEWHLAEYAAVTRNAYGGGMAYYVGAVMQEQSFYDLLIDDVLRTANVHPVLTPPPGVEISVRTGNGRCLLFLINHTQERQTVHLPSKMCEVLSGQCLVDRVTLDRYGVSILEFEGVL